MPSELLVHAVNEGGMRIDASAGDHAVSMDHPLRPGEVAAGFTPLQLLLASLAGCAGNTLALLLRTKMSLPVRSIEVDVRGRRRDQHPTVITDIALEFVVHGAVDPSAVARALAQSEERLCPVWAMLKPGTAITSSFRVVED